MVQEGVTSVKLAMEKLEHFLELGGTKKDITLLVISGIALIVSIFDLVPLPFDASWAAIILCGIPIILEAVIGLVTAFDIKADVLVSLALIASVCIGEDFAAGEVAFIMQLGGLLEELTVARARAGIEKLVHLTPQTARVILGGKETAVPAEAVKVGEDSSIQRMIRLVQSADAGKAKIVGLADRWATWIVVIALTAAALTWIISGEIIRAVTILVVFCPCALVLATPTAIMAAIGNASRHGFLVREGDALERLAAVKKITFSKTGTLTYGTPRVVLVHSALPSLSDNELYRLCAAAEHYSEHPLGKAITRCCQQETGEAENFRMVPGRGVSACVDGKTLLAGNAELLAEHHIAIPEEAAKAAVVQLSQGCTVTYAAVDGVFAGFLALSDTIREESANMIDRLSALQVQPVLLTGDHQNAAAAIAAIDIVARPHATLDLHIALDSPVTGEGVVGSVLRVCAHEYATVNVTCTQTLDDSWIALDDTGLFLDEGARVNVQHTVLGAGASATGLAGDLLGDTAKITIDTDYLGAREQVRDFNYELRHRGRKTECEIDANGVLTGTSKKVYRGTIDLVHGCKGATGTERETVLLANKGVDNKTVPVILCDEDDVAGNHGATIGHVRDEQLFYLACRGLDQNAAEDLFIRAKLEDAALSATDERTRAAVVRLGNNLIDNFEEELA